MDERADQKLLDEGPKLHLLADPKRAGRRALQILVERLERVESNKDAVALARAIDWLVDSLKEDQPWA